MEFASFSVSADAPVLPTLSLPAKSTRLNYKIVMKFFEMCEWIHQIEQPLFPFTAMVKLPG